MALKSFDQFIIKCGNCFKLVHVFQTEATLLQGGTSTITE